MRSTLIIVASFSVAVVARGQSAMVHPPRAASPAATQQIQAIKAASAALATQDAAKSAGFEPALGWIPTMGTHWVNGSRMLAGKSSNITEPSQLMFSPVDGKETLVGVAFAYYAPAGDTTRPHLLDGNPAWHDHPDLAPAGVSLVMLHVWFVPSPDGPFAGQNPFLPFWAAGMTPPDTAQMRDPAMSRFVRKAALALAEVADTAGMFPVIAKREAVRTVLVQQREAIRALIPSGNAARTADDARRMEQVLRQIAACWDTIRDAYLKSAVSPAVNARMVAYIEDMLGDGMHMDHS